MWFQGFERMQTRIDSSMYRSRVCVFFPFGVREDTEKSEGGMGWEQKARPLLGMWTWGEWETAQKGRSTN